MNELWYGASIGLAGLEPKAVSHEIRMYRRRAWFANDHTPNVEARSACGDCVSIVALLGSTVWGGGGDDDSASTVLVE